MKHCPKCNRRYQDDSLRFCLDDGSVLTSTTSGREAPATEILPRVPETQKSSLPTIPSYPAAPRVSEETVRPTNPILTTGVIAIAVLLLALVGIVGYFVIKQSSTTQSNQAADATPTPANRETPTVKQTPAERDDSFTSTSQTGGPLKITASSSSVRLAVQSNTYYPANTIDGKRSTAWIEGVEGPGLGEWIRFDFDRDINLHRILIQPGYFKSPMIWGQNNRLQTVTVQFSDGSSRQLNFDNRMESQKVDVGTVKTRWVRLTIGSVYYGIDPDTAISEIAFEWEP